MSEFISIAKVTDLKPGEGRVITVGDREVALFNVGGKFYAISNTCAHQGGPLGEGTLDGNIVSCPWHGWRFDVTTGITVTMPTMNVEKFECVIEGDDVKIKLT